MYHINIIVEHHPDTYVAYALGLKNAVAVGEGDTYEQAVNDVLGAIRELVEEFGADIIDSEAPLLDASVEEVVVP